MDPQQNARLDDLLRDFNLPVPSAPAPDRDALQSRFDALKAKLADWEYSCKQLSDALVRDLGYLGVNFDSVRGLYSDSLAASSLIGWVCSDPQHIIEADCLAVSGNTWDPKDDTYHLPCRTAEETVVRDAVHVALAADWQDAGWAAAQVWPDGMPMAAESTGRLSQRVTGSTDPGCLLQLTTVDDQGQPAWSGTNTQPHSRELVQSVGRTTLSD